MQTADLFGYITEVVSTAKGKPRKERYDFKVFTTESKKTYLCQCRHFCPVQPGDRIYAKCQILSPTEVIIMEPPFVQIGTDKPSIVQSLARGVFGLGNQKAGLLHDKLHEEALKDPRFKQHPEKVSAYLENLALLWRGNQDTALLGAFANILKPDLMAKLLDFWYRKFTLRRLYLMGLTNRDIYGCKMHLPEIYEACLKNP